MTKNEFSTICDCLFREYGFIKRGKSYYLDLGSDIVGSIHFQNSGYGSAVYLNCGFSMKKCNEHLPFPKYRETNMDMRIAVPGKERIANKPDNYVYTTEMIKYELYSDNEIVSYIRNEIDTWFIPAIKNGMEYILHHEEYYRLMIKIAHILHKIPE